MSEDVPQKQGPPENRGTVNDCLLCEKEMLCLMRLISNNDHKSQRRLRNSVTG